MLAAGSRIVLSAGTVLFPCDDGVTGLELWQVSLSGVGQGFSQTYGLGCPGTGGAATLRPATRRSVSTLSGPNP